MNWRDFFYFSKGERRALTLLLCLITLSWIWLLLRGKEEMPVGTEADAVMTTPRMGTGGKQVIVGNARPGNPVDVSPEESHIDSFSPVASVQPASAVSKKRNAPSPAKRNRYRSYPRTEKYPAGTVVELNTADTVILKKVPGIGSVFARRIVKYRDLLGGFYSVAQLREVYGIDEERYRSLASWFLSDTAYIRKLRVNRLSAESLRKHPYIDYRQAKVIEQLRKQKHRLSGWENLQLLEEFTEADRKRLMPYFSFE